MVSISSTLWRTPRKLREPELLRRDVDDGEAVLLRRLQCLLHGDQLGGSRVRLAKAGREPQVPSPDSRAFASARRREFRSCPAEALRASHPIRRSRSCRGRRSRRRTVSSATWSRRGPGSGSRRQMWSPLAITASGRNDMPRASSRRRAVMSRNQVLPSSGGPS